MSMEKVSLADDLSLRRWERVGLSLALVLLLLIGGWGGFAEIASAVIAPGRLVVESNPKLVQHREGGIVGNIAIREGQAVAAGDLLMVLDGASTTANLAIVTKQLTELQARSARLQAIAHGNTALIFPAELAARRQEPEVAAILAAEQQLFTTHLSMLAEEDQQLKDRVAAYRKELSNYRARNKAAGRELALLKEEQAGLDKLFEKGVISLNRINQGKRAIARLEGEIATVSAFESDVQGRLSESELALAQLEAAARKKALEDWRDMQAQQVQLEEKRIAAQDSLDRLEIRAPQGGIVHELDVHTIGGVIAPGEVLMTIVPTDDTLVVEGRVRPTDVDQVHRGQEARIRFPALNMRTTPDVSGTVLLVGADLSVDNQTNDAWFDVRIELEGEDLAALQGVELVPGMPAEVFVKTGERSPLSYLLQPVTDQIERAFRE